MENRKKRQSDEEREKTSHYYGTIVIRWVVNEILLSEKPQGTHREYTGRLNWRQKRV